MEREKHITLGEHKNRHCMDKRLYHTINTEWLYYNDGVDSAKYNNLLNSRITHRLNAAFSLYAIWFILILK